ncbi:MAG: T9SS type A sorting domain-containing protein [Ferruginibacter sp.]|nr:T9SS type A sorting domain-containing protein [Cytophagales bacterium]
MENKTELTPTEMRQLELARKRERRKNGYAKSDSPDEYAKFERMIRTKEGTEVPEYEANYKLTELYAAQRASNVRKSKARTANLSWSERGPANVPGRTRGLLTHPDNPQRIWFAGSVGGGVWKTTDAGANWVNKTPNLPNLATTVLAMAPSDSKVIYAGTGEGFYNADAVNGDGIFKSGDGGETWQQLSATAGKIEFKNINRIIVDPTDANVLLACSNTGFLNNNAAIPFTSWILKSVDGGSSWSVVLALRNRIQQLLLSSPGDFTVQYAAVNGVGVYKSTDAGQNWTLSNQGMYPSGRVEIAVAPTNPSQLYAGTEGNLSGSGGSDLYSSEDAGASWQLVVEADAKPNINWLGGQGWYDNTLTVHPFDENTLYLGGVQLWKMNLIDGEGQTPQRVVTGVDEVNTLPFLDFINLGGTAFGGKLVVGNARAADYASVEIRFGPGKGQKAHRFTVGGIGAGVPTLSYQYRDYVDVPFEVWDITNNRQLMVSFRDQQEDGTFNLLAEGILPNGAPVERREYLYVSPIPYAQTPNPVIARNGGHVANYLYFLWPVLKTGAAWDPANLPESKLVINSDFLKTKLRVTQNVSDSYNQYGGKNAYVHPDHHNLVCLPVDAAAKTFKILNANDGGVYVSKPGTDPGFAQGDWIFAGNGYNTTQFYGVDKKRGADEYFGGTQDNGTWRSASLQQASASSSYLFQIGGDGFETSWNYFNTNRLIGASQFNNFRRSLNGGTTWSSAGSGYTDAGARSPFISQIAASQSNPDVLYTVGASGVWISDDFGGNWKLTPIPPIPWAFNGSLADVKVSSANNQIVWAGNALSPTGRIHVSTNGGRSFTATGSYPGATLGNTTGLATHPTEDSTAFALFSFANSPKILRTRNLGRTWEDISGFGRNPNSSTGFPDVAIYSLLVMPHNPNILWAGTEIGLVESTDGGATWALAQNGLPAVSIWELKVVDDQVVVATHGRGIWTVTIPELAREVVFVPYINDLRVATNGNLVVNSSLRSPYDSTLLYANNRFLGRLGKTAVRDTLTQYAYLEAGPVTVQLKCYLNGEEYVSTAKTTEFFVAKAAYSYKNAFDAPTTDFFGTGFSVRLVPGFRSGAIHSPHPYLNNNDYLHQLKTPIIVADRDAIFKYRDVVIAEPGEPGARFGSPDFYDYVIVEGTKDGLNWRPLETGYNSDYNARWRSAYDRGLAGNDSLFVAHSVDLLKSFAPGDTVFFRFRLYADGGLTAWGWAVDDLSIQEDYQAIANFTLVDASTEADLQPLADGDTINLLSVGRQLNIRANSYPDTVGSVVFTLDGQAYRTESTLPYALAGDDDQYPVNYFDWNFSLGTHMLTATPYAEALGEGKPGKPRTLTFTVVDGSDAGAGGESVEKLLAYPNPGNGKFTVELKGEADTEATVYVHDFQGKQVYQRKAALGAGSTNVDVDISGLPDGKYFLRAISGQQTFKSLQIIKRRQE